MARLEDRTELDTSMLSLQPNRDEAHAIPRRGSKFFSNSVLGNFDCRKLTLHCSKGLDARR